MISPKNTNRLEKIYIIRFSLLAEYQATKAVSNKPQVIQPYT